HTRNLDLFNGSAQVLRWGRNQLTGHCQAKRPKPASEGKPGSFGNGAPRHGVLSRWSTMTPYLGLAPCCNSQPMEKITTPTPDKLNDSLRLSRSLATLPAMATGRISKPNS